MELPTESTDFPFAKCPAYMAETLAIVASQYCDISPNCAAIKTVLFYMMIHRTLSTCMIKIELSGILKFCINFHNFAVFLYAYVSPDFWLEYHIISSAATSFTFLTSCVSSSVIFFCYWRANGVSKRKMFL